MICIDVMEWMLDIQLGRRNLSPIQRIAITEKIDQYMKIMLKKDTKTKVECNKPHFEI